MSKNDSLPRLAYDDRNILLEGGIVGDQAIHRFGIRRFYNELPGKVVGAEKESDLIEVVLIELSKLKGLDGISEERLATLFYNTPRFISTIEQQEGVVLPKLTREVGTMLDTEKLMEKVKKEGR